MPTTEDWRYRYNWMSEREHKRLYLKLDSLHNPVAGTDWVYYLLGGAREQLAVFHGQERMLPACSDSFSVYLYPTEYLTNGVGNILALTTKPLTGSPNGMKEYNVVDNLGSTRVRLSLMTPTTTTDYEPFGSILAGTESRKSYIDKEFDRESELGDYGVRKYDPVTGRFLSVEPLWEKCCSVTPYCYSQNSPVMAKDPGGDELLGAVTGAVVGAVVGGGYEAVRQEFETGKVDWNEVGLAATKGMIIGAITGATNGLNLLASAAVSGGAEVVGGIYERGMRSGFEPSKTFASTDLGSDLLSGAVGGTVGKKFSDFVEPLGLALDKAVMPRMVLSKNGWFREEQASASLKVLALGIKIGVRELTTEFLGGQTQSGLKTPIVKAMNKIKSVFRPSISANQGAAKNPIDTVKSVFH